jgi:hypothetical protein
MIWAVFLVLDGVGAYALWRRGVPSRRLAVGALTAGVFALVLGLLGWAASLLVDAEIADLVRAGAAVTAALVVWPLAFAVWELLLLAATLRGGRTERPPS